METIEARLKKRIHVLDGAIGTMTMQGEGDAADIHRAYLEAGADIITTDTFNSNPLSLEGSGKVAHSAMINRRGAMLAQSAVDDYCKSHGCEEGNRPLVAGSMGPTTISLSKIQEPSLPFGVDFHKMEYAFRIQASALIEGGSDILLLETIYDALNAKAAIRGIMNAFETTGKRIPVMISATLTEWGRLPSGHSLEELCSIAAEIKPLSIGLNCGFGVKSLARHLSRLSSLTDSLISFHPNAGLPDKSGRYPYSPADFLDEVRKVLQSVRVDIIGGCCGTTPEHIRLIAEEVHSNEMADSKRAGAPPERL